MSWWDFRNLDNNDEDDDSIIDGSSSYFGRSYYGRKYKSSLGWSSRKLTDTTTYYSRSWGGYGSSYDDSCSNSDKEKLILLTRAYKSVRDMVIILDFPFDVEVELSNYHLKPFFGDKTRRIQVPSDVIDIIDYSDDDKVNIICGLGTQEAANLKYTEYRVFNDFVKTSTKFELFLTSLIESRRVEDKLLSERPGYLDFIVEANNFKYKKLEGKINLIRNKLAKNFLDFIYSVIKFIRYPDKLSSDIIKKYEVYFNKIGDILSGDYQFTKDSCILGHRLYIELLSMLSELNIVSGLEEFMRVVFPDSNEYVIRYGFDKDSTANLPESNISGVLRGRSSRLYTEIISGKLEFGDDSMTYIEHPEGIMDDYLKIKESIKKYIPGIKKLIRGTDKNYEFSIHGCREGALDTNKLAEAYQGVPQVYIKKGKVSTNKTTVCVLIDQSGSMGCSNKIGIAKKAAVLLNESLKDLPGVDLYIYGHSADMKTVGDTILYTYREGSKYCPKFSLSSVDALRENRDGTAIYETAKRVRKFTQENCIMFVLSDGEPAACGYTGYSAIKDVHDKVKSVENMGFTVIQVSIDSVYRAKEMFTNVISLEYDLANFPKRLSQVIKKAIVENKQTTVS